VIDQAAIHADMGMALAQKGQMEDALKSAEKGLDLWKQIDHPLGVGRQLADIAVIYALQKKTDVALRKLTEARRNFQKAGANSDEFRALEQRVRAALRGRPIDGSNGKIANAKGEPMMLAERA
jgi:tetratricopeptide (TPR) repeat protein